MDDVRWVNLRVGPEGFEVAEAVAEVCWDVDGFADVAVVSAGVRLVVLECDVCLVGWVVSGGDRGLRVRIVSEDGDLRIREPGGVVPGLEDCDVHFFMRLSGACDW